MKLRQFIELLYEAAGNYGGGTLDKMLDAEIVLQDNRLNYADPATVQHYEHRGEGRLIIRMDLVRAVPFPDDEFEIEEELVEINDEPEEQQAEPIRVDPNW